MAGSNTDSTNQSPSNSTFPSPSLVPPITPPRRKPVDSILTSTPRLHSSNNANTLTTTRPKIHKQKADDMNDRFVWMTYENFVDQLAPGPNPTAAQWEKFSTFGGIAPVAFEKKEALIYRALVCCVNNSICVSSSLTS